MWTFLLACSSSCSPPERPVLGHYAAALDARNALVQGDLDGFKSACRDLDEDLEGPHVDTLHGGVGMAVAASDLLEAGWGLGGVVEGCAGCHAGQSGPVVARTVTTHAEAHDVLWANVVSGRPVGLELEPFADLAPDQVAAFGTMDAPEAYGELLATCASCHALR